MTLELIEDAFGDARNAAFLAHAADLAYLPEATGAPRYKEELGLDARLISENTTQVYLAGNADHLVAAFRGTESPATLEGLKDWLLTDAMNLLTVPSGRLGTDFIAAGVGARFHKGFIDALAVAWEPLASGVAEELKRADRPLWITGHSLGGALALMAAWLFQRRFVSVHQVYTFGAPMIGNSEAMAAFEKELSGKVFRYVSGMDPVPLLPTISLLANAYRHCPNEVMLGGAAAGITAGEVFRQLGAAGIDGVLSGALLNDVWNAVSERVGAHLMDNYRSLIMDKPG